MSPTSESGRDPALTAAMTDKWLHLVVLPTEACNFRCTYCYEEFRLGRMRREVEQGLLRLLERRVPDLDDLALSWFGGEPLLAFDVVERILVHVQRLLQQYPRVRFLSDMTTNGARLDRPTFERLYALGVRRYQISLDGPQIHHDRTRVRPKHEPTFDVIWRNLLDIGRSDARVDVRIRIHVHDDNVASLPELLSDLAAAFGTDPRFHVFFKPVKPLGGPNDARFPFLAPARSPAALAALADRARSLGLQVQGAGGATSMCYAARANSFVVRPDGRINKCTVAFEHPANQVGRLDAEGRLHLVEAALSGWTRGLRSGDPAALHCPMRGLADGVGRADPQPASVSA